MVLVKKEAPIVDSCIEDVKIAVNTLFWGLNALHTQEKIGSIPHLVLIVMSSNIALNETCFARSHLAQQN